VNARIFVVCAFVVATSCKQEEKPKFQVSGREVYRAACRRCHGDDGRGGPPVNGNAPKNLRDKAFQASRTDEQLKEAIRNGNAQGMPPFRAAFTEEELNALIAYVRTLVDH
jgi:quinoprotein glucose dehydrogenase